MAFRTSEDIELERVKQYQSGVQSIPTFHSGYTQRGGISHQWKGPSVYLPFSSYVQLDDYGPKYERIQHRNNFWWRYNPSEIKISHCHQPFNQKWDGNAVFYSAYHDKLLNEHETTIVPRDARLFFNEEDWLKYKGMVERPRLPGLGLKEVPEKRKAFINQRPSIKVILQRNSPLKLWSGK